MSGTFPTTVKLSRLKIQSVTPTLESITHSLKRKVRTRGGQRWTIEGDFTTISRSEWSELFGFCMAQRGKYEAFTFTHPAISTPYGSPSGAPTIDSGQTTTRELITSNWGAGATLKAGSFFKFTNHAKVYMVTQDFTADGSGDGTINFDPAVQETITSGEELIYSDVPFTVSFAEDVLETVVKTNWAYELVVKLVETP